MRNVVYRRERPLSTPVFSNGFRPVHMLKCIFRKLRLRTGKSFVKESKYRKSFDTDIRDSVVIHEIVDNYTPTFLAEKSQKLKLQTVDDTSKAVEKAVAHTSPPKLCRTSLERGTTAQNSVVSTQTSTTLEHSELSFVSQDLSFHHNAPSMSARLEAQMHALESVFSRIRAAQNLKKKDLHRKCLSIDASQCSNYNQDEGRDSLETHTGKPWEDHEGHGGKQDSRHRAISLQVDKLGYIAEALSDKSGGRKDSGFSRRPLNSLLALR